MKKKSILLLLLVLLLWDIACFASSNEKGDMYYKYGLNEKAKEEYIEIIFESNESLKPEAYYKLGNIAFEENKIEIAIETWSALLKNYPNSNYSKIVKDKLEILKEVVGKTTKGVVDNAEAAIYLKNGDFWSDGKSDTFHIDSSWIDNVDASITWYDLVITKFPKTVAAEEAYISKLKTLLGWTESGRYGSSYGLEKNFEKYIPLVLSTFYSFEKEFPNSSTLQAFRFQIAQSYWKDKQWDNTRKWLNIIIKEAGDKDLFYKDLAERRLQKVEY